MPIPLPSIPEILDPQYSIEEYTPDFELLKRLELPRINIQKPTIYNYADLIKNIVIQKPDLGLDQIIPRIKELAEQFTNSYIKTYLNNRYGSIIDQFNSAYYEAYIRDQLIPILLPLVKGLLIPNVDLPIIETSFAELITNFKIELDKILDKIEEDKEETLYKLATLNYRYKSGKVIESLEKVDYEGWFSKNELFLKTKAKIVSQLVDMIISVANKVLNAQLAHIEIIYKEEYQLYLKEIENVFDTITRSATRIERIPFDSVLNIVLQNADEPFVNDSLRREMYSKIESSFNKLSANKYEAVLNTLLAYTSGLVNLYNLDIEEAKAKLSRELEINKNILQLVKKAELEIENASLDHTIKAQLLELATSRYSFEIEKRRLLTLQYLGILSEGIVYKADIERFIADVEKLSAKIDVYANSYRLFKAKAEVTEAKIQNQEIYYRGKEKELNLRRQNLELDEALGQANIQLYEIAERILSERLRNAEEKLRTIEADVKASLIKETTQASLNYTNTLLSFENSIKSSIINLDGIIRGAKATLSGLIDQQQINRVSVIDTTLKAETIRVESFFRRISELKRALALACANVTARIIELTGG